MGMSGVCRTVLLLSLAFFAADLAKVSAAVAANQNGHMEVAEGNVDIAAGDTGKASSNDADDEVEQRDLCPGHAHYKLCALFATKHGKKTLTNQELRSCCERIEQFEATRNKRGDGGNTKRKGADEQLLLQLDSEVATSGEGINKEQPIRPTLKLTIPATVQESAAAALQPSSESSASSTEGNLQEGQVPSPLDVRPPVLAAPVDAANIDVVTSAPHVGQLGGTKMVVVDRQSVSVNANTPGTGAIMAKVSSENGKPELLVAVATAPRHFEERRAIRETWASMVDNENFITGSDKGKVAVKFFIGRIASSEEDPAGLNREIEREASEHSDIVRLADVTEAYANLTIKSIEMMRYARDNGFKSFFKTDDDSFVRIDQLLRFMSTFKEKSTYYSAHCTFDFPTNDNPDSKNYMRDTFDHDTIPVLCHGGGYYVGDALVRYLVDAWDRNDLVHHRNEDVAVSLWLTGPDSKAPNLVLDPNLEVTFFWEQCNPESIYLNPMRLVDMYDVWRNLMDTKNPCANDFELQEYLDLLDQMNAEENASASNLMEFTGKPLNAK